MEETGTRAKRLQPIVNYADDFVICCRGNADEAMRDARDHAEAEIDGQRGEDTFVGPLNGSTFWATRSGRVTRDGTGWRYIAERPSKKRFRRIVANQRVDGTGGDGWQETTEIVGQLNRSWLAGRTTSHRAHRPTVPRDRQHTLRGSVGGCVRSTRWQGRAYPLSNLYVHFGLVRLTLL